MILFSLIHEISYSDDDDDDDDDNTLGMPVKNYEP